MSKFRKMNSPAFYEGEEWVSSSGSRVRIKSTRPYVCMNGKWDWDVTYVQSNGVEHSKNGWAFQVRYEHVSDRNKS